MNQNNNSHIKKVLLGLFCLILAAGVAYYLNSNPPKADKTKPPQTAVQVEIISAKRVNYSVTLESYGTTQARTRSALTAQVSGEVVKVAEQFQSGRFFEKGDLLLEIDPRDYQAALESANASLAQAQSSLLQEQAQAKQAAQDWARLGYNSKAPNLVLRKPQLTAAKAQLAAAQAQHTKAQTDLSRTQIKAPYAGRIITKNSDIGQFVTASSQVAEIFATDYIEVRLPLSAREYAQLDLPRNYRGQRQPLNIDLAPKVLVDNTIGNTSYQWQGFITRSESTFDNTTQQTYVIAQINEPYKERADGAIPLKIGQFVKAKIQAKTLKNVYIVPNGAVYQGSYVYVVIDDFIQRRNIEIIWQDNANSIINQGLKNNDQIVITALNDTISGTKVDIIKP